MYGEKMEEVVGGGGKRRGAEQGIAASFYVGIANGHPWRTVPLEWRASENGEVLRDEDKIVFVWGMGEKTSVGLADSELVLFLSLFAFFSFPPFFAFVKT